MGSEPEHDGVTPRVIGQEDRHAVSGSLVSRANIASASIAPIRAPCV
jgi:hypothetical protein